MLFQHTRPLKEQLQLKFNSQCLQLTVNKHYIVISNLLSCDFFKLIRPISFDSNPFAFGWNGNQTSLILSLRNQIAGHVSMIANRLQTEQEVEDSPNLSFSSLFYLQAFILLEHLLNKVSCLFKRFTVIFTLHN